MADVQEPPNAARDAALQYARIGWPVLPLDRGLNPIEHEPTTDQTTIVLWWSRYPEAQPGVVLGRQFGRRLFLVALIDHGSQSATAYLQARNAPNALSPGHLIKLSERAWLFASPEPLPSRELAPGLEVRGDGVMPLPPSGDARGLWTWRKGHFLPETSLAAAPHWLRVAEPEPARAPDEPAVAADWVAEIVRSRNGGALPTLANATLILRCDDRWAGRLTYNEMSLGVALDGQPLDDAAVIGMREAIERRYGAVFSDGTMRDALLVIASRRKFHPVRSYLEGLRWDGVARINELVGKTIPVDGNAALAKRMIRSFFISAVARARNPGCQVDTCLVLVSREQGMFKSRFFRRLAEPWFSDTALDPTNKDALQQIAAAWIYELGEIDSITSRKHASDMKRFMTSSSDTFRPPYERAVRVVPRSGVLVGSTNKERFLTDDTGSRRFWVVRISGKIDYRTIERQRDNIWAEAVVAYEQGETWWLSSDEERERESDAEEHAEQDPWLPMVVRFFQERFRQRELQADYTCQEIASAILKIERKDQTRATEMRIGDVLRSLGFTRRKMRIERNGFKMNPTWTWCMPADQPNWLLTETKPEDFDADAN